MEKVIRENCIIIRSWMIKILRSPKMKCFLYEKNASAGQCYKAIAEKI